jgi:hypothetical protein
MGRRDGKRGEREREMQARAVDSGEIEQTFYISSLSHLQGSIDSGTALVHGIHMLHVCGCM